MAGAFLLCKYPISVEAETPLTDLEFKVFLTVHYRVWFH